MKRTILTGIFFTLTLAAGAAFAGGGDHAGDGWASGFNTSAIKELAARNAAAVPEPPAPQSDGPAAQVSAQRSGQLPEDYDPEKAQLLASIALRNNIGYFSHRCYQFVANYMEWAGIIKPWQWSSLGISPVSPADFAAWADAKPVALRKQLSLVKMETPEKVADLPLGGIVVYQRGACGFSPKHGHIEVVVAPNKLCSDGCQTFMASCLSNPSVRSGISVYVPVKRAD